MVSDPTAQTFFNVAGYPDQVNNPTAFVVSLSFVGAECTASWPAQTGAAYYQVFLGATPFTMLPVQPKLYETSFVFSVANSPYIQVCAVSATRLQGTASIVQAVQAVNSGTSLVYYGFVNTTTPTSTNITNMASTRTATALGNYALTQTGASSNYPCFAVPTSYTQPTTFKLNGFVTGLQTSTVTINGEAYQVYLSPFFTAATNIPAVLS